MAPIVIPPGTSGAFDFRTALIGMHTLDVMALANQGVDPYNYNYPVVGTNIFRSGGALAPTIDIDGSQHWQFSNAGASPNTSLWIGTEILCQGVGGFDPFLPKVGEDTNKGIWSRDHLCTCTLSLGSNVDKRVFPSGVDSNTAMGFGFGHPQQTGFLNLPSGATHETLVLLTQRFNPARWELYVRPGYGLPGQTVVLQGVPPPEADRGFSCAIYYRQSAHSIQAWVNGTMAAEVTDPAVIPNPVEYDLLTDTKAACWTCGAFLITGGAADLPFTISLLKDTIFY